MRYKKLSDICGFVKGKIDIASLTQDTYISTENMLANKAGIVAAAMLPIAAQTQRYEKGDVLISNIRPYFKKIWHSIHDGGCSNDVLVFRAKENVSSEFLYYVLSDDKFFDYATATSKGTKMPRGDKRAVMEYDVPDFSLEDQQRIASILKSLDDKIALNRTINKNLEEQAQTFFSYICSQSTKLIPFTELIDIAGGGTPKTGNIDFWNGEIPFFTPKDVGTPYAITTEKHITEMGLEHCNSALYPINTVFVTARGTIGKISISGVPMAMNQSCYALLGKGISQILVYFYARAVIRSLQHKANGAVFDTIVTRDFETENICEFDDSTIASFVEFSESIYQKILNNTIETDTLIKLRDTMLPQLLSGKLDISNIHI